jgi:hypothetical protein
VLAALVQSPATAGLAGARPALRLLGVAIGVTSLILLVLAIVQVRRLPTEPAPARLGQYPRRMR